MTAHEGTNDGNAGLRRRLGWLLIVRLGLVSLFLAVAALVYRPHATETLDPRLGLIALGYGVTAISGLLLGRVRRILAFAGLQLTVDLALVSLVILVTGGLDSPLAVLYNVVILNAALLGLGPGITATAAAAAAVYGGLMTTLALGAPPDLPMAPYIFSHTTIVISFLVIAALARYLGTQLATAESLLVERQAEIGRIETLQSLVANTLDHGLVTTDGSGRVQASNPTAVEILGTQPALGASLEASLPGSAALPIGGAPTELALSGGGESIRLVRTKVAAVTDTFQRPVGRIYVLQDVTTIREMESKLREQETIDAYAARAVLTRDDAPIAAFEGLVGESEPMRRVYSLIEKVAPADSTVLITGESGTGKELVARAIHQRSPRRDRDFVAVNCGAIPESLIESELFGHVRGAFTGAVADRPGLFRQAHGGTIFLDEIGELPLAMQVRLLRVLQDQQLAPVGGTTPITVDVRVVAATNRNLERSVSEGAFREDLYYRLNVIRIETPALRERPEDIPLLLTHLLQTCSARHGKIVERVSPRTMRALVNHRYPGNVRELENVVDHAITLCEGDALTEHDLPAQLHSQGEAGPAIPTAAPAAPATPIPTRLPQGIDLDDQLATYEKDMILAALDQAQGVRKHAAEILGIKYRSLRHRLSKYGLAVSDDENSLESSDAS